MQEGAKREAKKKCCEREERNKKIKSFLIMFRTLAVNESGWEGTSERIFRRVCERGRRGEKKLIKKS
jgi:hypothetical protein